MNVGCLKYYAVACSQTAKGSSNFLCWNGSWFNDSIWSLTKSLMEAFKSQCKLKLFLCIVHIKYSNTFVKLITRICSDHLCYNSNFLSLQSLSYSHGPFNRVIMSPWVIVLTSPVVLGAPTLQFTGKYREESTVTAVFKPSVSHSRLKSTLSVALLRLTPLNPMGQRLVCTV